MLVASHHLTCTQVPISADRLWCNCLYHRPDIRRQDKGMLRVRAYGCCYSGFSLWLWSCPHTSLTLSGTTAFLPIEAGSLHPSNVRKSKATLEISLPANPLDIPGLPPLQSSFLPLRQPNTFISLRVLTVFALVNENGWDPPIFLSCDISIVGFRGECQHHAKTEPYGTPGILRLYDKNFVKKNNLKYTVRQSIDYWA